MQIEFYSLIIAILMAVWIFVIYLIGWREPINHAFLSNESLLISFEYKMGSKWLVDLYCFTPIITPL